MSDEYKQSAVADEFTIFHFSDTHFGANFSDSRKSKLQNFFTDVFQKALNIIGLAVHDANVYRVLLDEFARRTKEVQHLCVFVHSGDVSAFGSNENLRLGNGLLGRIRSLFAGKLPETDQSLFIIPGNHDIININDKVDFPFNTDAFDLEFYGVNGLNVYPRILEPILPKNAIVLLGLNSVNVDGNRNIKSAIGIGLIEETQLQEAESFLAKRMNCYQRKIVVLHHSPLNFPNIHNMKGLILENAVDFIEWLYGNKIDLVLCGHLHKESHIYESLEVLLRKFNNISSIKVIEKVILKIIVKRENLKVRPKFRIGGKFVGDFEKNAFSFIERRLGNVILEKKVRKSLKRFYERLKEYPQYMEFMDMIENIKRERMRIIVAGTACQLNSNSGYNYWEIKMNLKNNIDNIYNNSLNVKTNFFIRNFNKGLDVN